jgi:DNA helicase-2/ATP-dependent DNA helicase PcrA
MPHTPQQQEAIGCIGQNLQIIACAGSGKTRVLAARTVEILRQEGLRPRNIVAFTFTEKAAAELKERIATMVAAQLGPVPGLAEMYVGTIHGFCLDFLQSYLFRFLKYSVLNEVQTRLIVARNSRKSGLAEVEIITGPSQGQKLTRGGRDVRVFLETLNVLREDNVDQGQIPAPLLAAWDRYTDLLNEHRYLDYSEILVQAATALIDPNDPDCVRAQQQIAERVRYLVVDEYQDVNPIQETLIRRLHQLGANVCVVGDDDQTIYQWRGSEIRNIIEFQQRYPAVRQVTLAENFRSSEGVVAPAAQIADLNNPNRLPKEMVAAGHQISEPGDVLALTFANPQDEATWIANKVLAMRGIPFQDGPDSQPRGLSWSDCAVLLRTLQVESRPFPVRGYKRIAVKVVDVYGNESTVVKDLNGR